MCNNDVYVKIERINKNKHKLLYICGMKCQLSFLRV